MRTQNARISASSLTPCQHITDRKFRVAADFRVAQLLKHPHLSEFHSLAEYYHAALLEGDPAVAHYVPQPFQLAIGNRRYIPDCFLMRDGQAEVVELRPQARFDERRRDALAAYFQRHSMRFVVVPNEAVLSRQTEATNWLMIIRVLVCHRGLDTTHAEMTLLDEVYRRGGGPLGEWVWRQDRASSRGQEIALFRLLHQGKLRADLAEDRLSYQTEVRPW